MIRPFRKPLVVFTPKSLLRNKDASSPLDQLVHGRFQTVIGEVDPTIQAKKIKRMMVCSGKVYYDLVTQRRERERDDVAIVRIEQIYPFPHKQFASELRNYPNLTEIVWVQDEPQNQGFWFQAQHYLREHMTDGMKLGYAGRPALAAPASGYYEVFVKRQKDLLDAAFARLKNAQVI
jgi:2-oxoglutarate dehydrogenase E1 component